MLSTELVLFSITGIRKTPIHQTHTHTRECWNAGGPERNGASVRKKKWKQRKVSARDLKNEQTKSERIGKSFIWVFLEKKKFN